MIEFIRPHWPAPPTVHALTTTRRGGVSAPPWESFNLGAHVGDDPGAVAENRRRLHRAAALPEAVEWLDQVHGTRIRVPGSDERCADGRFSDRPEEVCAVLTADCLPILLCNRSGTAVAAVHAGWRGLLAGVVEAALDCFPDDPSAIMAWMGPAIGPDAFEVGGEVREAFLEEDPGAAPAFRGGRGGRWLADLYTLARRRFQRRGVTGIHGGGFCTYQEAGRFFSYRREWTTGRMASLIWLESGE